MVGAAAAPRRAALVEGSSTTGYRVVNGENDGLPGVVVDRYADTLVLKLYSSAWLVHLEDLLDALRAVWEPERIVLRLARVVQRVVGDSAPADGATLVGEPPVGPVIFLENGLRVAADVVSGQKTGWFLDQRDNRERVRRLSRGAEVLDVFCAGGGFTLHAAAGGASSVHSVDLSAAALEATRRNLLLNSDRAAVARCVHRSTEGDAVEVMGELRRRGARVDLVVVDPPSFAAKQQQVEGALRAYRRLTGLAVDLLRPGGRLVQASCSARVPTAEFLRAVQEGAAERGVDLGDVHVTGHPIDHPVGFPEGAYLKAVFARIGDRGGAR